MLLSSLSHFFPPLIFFVCPKLSIMFLLRPSAREFSAHIFRSFFSFFHFSSDRRNSFVRQRCCLLCVCIPSRLFTHTLLLLFFFSPRHDTSMWIRRSNVYHPRDRHPARSGRHFVFFFFSPRVGTFVGVASQSNLDDRFDSTKKQHWLSSLSLAASRRAGI